MKNLKNLILVAGGLMALNAAATIITNGPAESLTFDMPSDGRVAIVDTMQGEGGGIIVLGMTDVSLDYPTIPVTPTAYTNIVRGMTVPALVLH